MFSIPRLEAPSISITSKAIPSRNLAAVFADTAGGVRRPLLAVDGLGENPRHGGLSTPARTGEDIGVGDPLVPYAVADGAGYVPWKTTASKSWGRHFLAITWYDIVSLLGRERERHRAGAASSGPARGIRRRNSEKEDSNPR